MTGRRAGAEFWGVVAASGAKTSNLHSSQRLHHPVKFIKSSNEVLSHHIVAAAPG